MGKFIYRFFAVTSVAFLGFILYQATLTGHQSNMPGTLSAGSGLVQSVMNKLGPASDRGISEFTASMGYYADGCNNFLRVNKLRARAELATMATDLPSTFGDWLPKNGSNWLQNTAQTARNNPGAVANKIPVVNGALNATKERIAAVGQSVGGAASGF
jgi:hypothetical protein